MRSNVVTVGNAGQVQTDRDWHHVIKFFDWLAKPASSIIQATLWKAVNCSCFQKISAHPAVHYHVHPPLDYTIQSMSSHTMIPQIILCLYSAQLSYILHKNMKNYCDWQFDHERVMWWSSHWDIALNCMISIELYESRISKDVEGNICGLI
jgi:hypothetical protein